MPVEVLDESQPWRIEFPNEDVYRNGGRWLRAIKIGGAVQRDWVWSDEEAMWTDRKYERQAGDYYAWSAVIAMCMRNGWTLYSMPPEKPDVDQLDAGTAEMVRKQIASHITLPAFVAESCQFDGLTDGGKEEWRAIFRAGLEAYLTAGDGK